MLLIKNNSEFIRIFSAEYERKNNTYLSIKRALTKKEGKCRDFLVIAWKQYKDGLWKNITEKSGSGIVLSTFYMSKT